MIRPVLSAISVPSRAGARPSGRMPTRLRAAPSKSCDHDLFGRRESPCPSCGACRSPRSGWPRPARSSRRCRGHRGRARLPGAANRAHPGRSAALPARPAARGRRFSASLACHGNLEAVLAGIAGARDRAVDAIEFSARRRHECERLQPSGNGAPARLRPWGPAAPAARGHRLLGELHVLRQAHTRRRRRRRPCRAPLKTRPSMPSSSSTSGRVTIRSSTMPPLR